MRINNNKEETVLDFSMFESLQRTADMENAHVRSDVTPMHRIPKRYDDGSVSRFPEKTPIAMAYVPMQKAPIMYENLEDAFKKGTIFPELDKPFFGKRGKK